MSSIAITGGATGTGVFSLLAPSTSTNRTLTLPDSTGTVLNDQSNIEAQVKTATNASGSAPVYACRAWVNFNGIGTVAIRASGNVSSITDFGTGNYGVNFSTAMPDENYSVITAADITTTFIDTATKPTLFATGSCRVQHFEGNAFVDTPLYCVAVFR